MQVSDFAPFSAAVGALLGAAATYVFAVRAESGRNYQRLRTEAYVDLIRSVAAIAIAQRQADAPKEAEATALLADAKTRIAVYGSAKVASTLATFYRDHGTLDTPAASTSFANIVLQMRAETRNAKTTLSARDIGQILFSRDP